MGSEFFLVLSLMGCGGTPMDRQIPIARGRPFINRQIDTLGAESIVPIPPGQVWDALGAVYEELGLKVNFREPSGPRIGVCYQEVRARLGNELMSTYVDCGDSRSMPNADRFEVALTVLSTVVPNSSGTSSIFTFVLGVGADGAGSSPGKVWCFSKGALEQRISDGVSAKTRP